MKSAQLCVFCCLLFAVSAQAETATLKMRFVFDGKPPAPKFVGLVGQPPVLDERLLVDLATRGIGNAVVCVDLRRSDLPLKHGTGTSQKRVLATNRHRFDPHVVVARAGDTLQLVNRDAVAYAPSIGFWNNAPVGPALAGSKWMPIPLELSEPAPVPISCNIYPWMNASLVVLDHSFVAVSDQDGSLQIEGLPANRKLFFRAFHESGVITIR